MSTQPRIERAAGEAPTASRPLAPPSPPHPHLITDITVEHGPVDVLGRFFLVADTAARRRGVTVEFGTFEELLEVNRKNSESWKTLTTMYDHRYCPKGLAPDCAFCLLGRDGRGEVVATQASRLFEVDDSDTLYDVAVSSRMFYDEPAAARARGERCEVSATIAHTIRGRLVINGAVWYHPTFRKRQLSMIIPRITRAYAYTHWKIDHSMGLAMEGPTRGGIIDSVGYPHREWDLRLFNAPNGDPRCCICWIYADEMLEDLRAFSASFDAQVDVGIDQRRAQQRG